MVLLTSHDVQLSAAKPGQQSLSLELQSVAVSGQVQGAAPQRSLYWQQRSQQLLEILTSGLSLNFFFSDHDTT